MKEFRIFMNQLQRTLSKSLYSKAVAETRKKFGRYSTSRFPAKKTPNHYQKVQKVQKIYKRKSAKKYLE
jgi:hypothetical protein